MKLNYIIYTIFILFILFLFKLNIDTLIKKPISPEELADYNYKINLVLDKVYDAKIKDDSAIAIHIKSLNKKNDKLIDLTWLHKNNMKDKYISFSEYNKFKDLFNSTYVLDDN